MSAEQESEIPQAPPLKVGLVGPSGIGKTSIIVSLLHEARSVLSGTDVQIRPIGDTTAKIDTALRKLRSHIQNRRFNPSKGIAGSKQIDTFELEIAITSLISNGVKIEALDYPGAWLGNEAERNWSSIQQFIVDSEVLIVPIDAAIIMEARTTSQMNKVSDFLHVEAVERVIEHWAKARNEQSRPCALLLTPLRCEAFLDDNGGEIDRAMEMETKVLDWYDPVIKRFKEEHHAPELLYCPVDTMGCVDLQRIRWQSSPPELRFNIRGSNPKLQPRGTGDIFVNLINRYLTYLSFLQNQHHQQTSGKAEDATKLANKDEGFIFNIWNWLDGTTAERRRKADRLSAQARAQAEALSELAQTLSTIRNLSPSGRLKQILLSSTEEPS